MKQTQTRLLEPSKRPAFGWFLNCISLVINLSALLFYMRYSGYVPPEYVRKGVYSMKYDVYSFGVLLLQIISGKRNSCYYGTHETLTLLEYVSNSIKLFFWFNLLQLKKWGFWNIKMNNAEWFQAYEKWIVGEGMDFIDPSLDDSSSSCKLITCLQVALLCVQENPVDRPTMLEVYSMLKNDIGTISTPKRPAFSTQIDENVKGRSTSEQGSCSVYDSSISQISGRWPRWCFWEMIY